MYESTNPSVDRFEVTVWKDDTFSVLLKDSDGEIQRRDTSIDKAYFRALQERIYRKKQNIETDVIPLHG